jgi:hypothetical protein
VDPDVRRILAEDETAHAMVERAAQAARERIERERKRIEEEREGRLRSLSAKVDEAVARILADAERDVAVRRARRERWLEERAKRADGLLESAAGTFIEIIRDRPRKKTL